jgi:hypothetical protein
MKSIDYEEFGEYMLGEWGFYAMDRDGSIYLYENEPEIDFVNFYWVQGKEGWDMNWSAVNVGNLPSDWKQSLRKIKRYSQPTKDTKWGTPCEALLNNGWTECIFLGVENDIFRIVPRGTFQVEYIECTAIKRTAIRIQNK